MAVKNYRVYAERRRRLGRKLGKDGIILVPGAKMAPRNNDVEYPFRQESSFFYLTGFVEPDALLIILGGSRSRSILFCNPKDEKLELWTGKRWGAEGATQVFGMHEAYENNKEGLPGAGLHTEPVQKLDLSILTRLLRNRRVIYYPENRETGIVSRSIIDACLERTGVKKTLLFLDGDRLLGEMRLIKDKTEIETMNHAAAISGEAYREIFAIVRPGMTEIALEAEFTYRFRRAGGDPCHAYQPIVAAGANACTLHHVSTDTRMKKGELVLIDAGCEYEGYASDITRTFPVSGKFTPAQRAIYEIVLAAQKAAIASAQANETLFSVHRKATLVICEGLIALGILKNRTPEEALASGAYRSFFPHHTSHWLGMDVHDVGDYLDSGSHEQRRMLKPGMVITVEPGIYMAPEMQGVEEKWRGIGIRIEDDVLITEEGGRVISGSAPKEIDEIESIMKK